MAKKTNKGKEFVKPEISENHRFLDTEALIKTELPWLTPAAVRNLVLRRKIPYRKPAGRLIFVRNEIREWIKLAPGLKLDEVENETDR